MAESENQVPVYFIRHKLKPHACSILRDRRSIAYHYLDEFHENLSDYSTQLRGLTQAHNAFRSISVGGAIVVAEYDDPNHFTVGRIIRGSRVLRVDIENDVFKVLEYIEPKTYSYSQQPLLAAIRPPFSAVCGVGRSFTQLIRHIYSGEPIAMGTDFMHPSSIELMCEAFLRSDLAPEEIRLRYTLLRTGKTMPAVDIYGRTMTGRKLFAQVTYGSEVPSKTRALVDFSGGTGITVLFSKDKSYRADGLDHHFCIDDVFGRFLNSTNKIWELMLKEMNGMTLSA